MSQVWSRVVSVLIQGGLWGWEALQKLSSATHFSKAKVNCKSFELDPNAIQACIKLPSFCQLSSGHSFVLVTESLMWQGRCSQCWWYASVQCTWERQADNTNVGLKICNFICQKRLIKKELVKTKFSRYIYLSTILKLNAFLRQENVQSDSSWPM